MSFFSRQIPVIGEKCQERLEKSSILIAGIGGLGTNVAQQFIRAGISELHIVDDSLIDAPDLNRQILYCKKDIGRKKVEVAKERLDLIGLNTKISIYENKIDDNFNLPEGIIGVVDCLDNFKTRYILDEQVHKKNVFLIHGGIHDLYGQITTIIPGKTRSLKEIFSNMRDKKDIIPVIGPVPTIVASIQVLETIKIICKMENNLINKLLFVNLNDYSFKIIELD